LYSAVVIKFKKPDILHHIFVDNFFRTTFLQFFQQIGSQCDFDIALLQDKVLGLLLALFANFVVKISALAMDQISIKTPNPKCRLYWCLITGDTVSRVGIFDPSF
jgi:hypothetical protein